MNCKICGRPLKPDENAYCPYCRNKKDKKLKNWFLGIGGCFVATLALVWGGKNKSK